jgi:peptidoglycan hydrolase-like protein with peptidoglycan-binding domain
VQQALVIAGYDLGPIDGVMGPRTRAAIRQAVAAPAPHAPSPADTQTVRLGANTGIEAP